MMMPTMVNQTLLRLAHVKVANERTMLKSAVVPPPPMDPAMMGGAPPGAPPMDPSMMGGAPPGAPPMDPSMMGGAPPMDPSMMGGAPPMDPAAMGGAPPMAPPAPPMDPAMMGGAPPGAAAPVKLKPEDRINQVDYRLYNMQQQLTAIMNSMGVELPAGALVTPPGSPVPVAEAAVPGGQQDPGPSQSGQQGGNGTGINPIEALGAFNPDGGGGGETKQAQQRVDIADLINNIVGRGVDTSILKSAEEMPQHHAAPTRRAVPSMQTNMAAAAAVLRSRMQSR